MNKKKIKIIIQCICIVTILIVLAFIAKYLFSVWQDKQTEKELQIQEEYYVDEIVWMGVAEDGISTCVVENVNDKSIRILPGKSVFLASISGVENECCGTEYTEYLLHEYSIQDGTLERTVDITNISGSYPEYILNQIYSLFILDEEVYIRVRLAIRPEEGETIYDYMDRQNIWKYLFINIETGEVVEEFNGQYTDMLMLDNYNILNNVPFLSDNISEDFAEKYYNFESLAKFSWKPNGCFKMDIEAIDLPHQNEELYSLFPELKNYIGQEGYYIHLVIGNSPSAEYLLRLLMEDGKEISFEHMEPIPADESIDGQEHEVHSFEEYYQWKDIYWRDR